jgi:hypothetical protein
MVTSERLAAEIHAGTGLNGHCKGIFVMLLGMHRLFAGGFRSLPLTSWTVEAKRTLQARLEERYPRRLL